MVVVKALIRMLFSTCHEMGSWMGQSPGQATAGRALLIPPQGGGAGPLEWNTSPNLLTEYHFPHCTTHALV